MNRIGSPIMPLNRALAVLCTVLAVWLLAGCERAPEPMVDAEAEAVIAGSFHDIGQAAGLNFQHDAGIEGEFLMPESIGAGVAIFDHDGDGDQDIYLVNGGSLQAGLQNQARNRLFSQQSNGQFVDRTEASGLGDAGYGMGVTLGDMDNDGDLDVFVSNYGADALYRNQGNGQFENITTAAGIHGAQWSTSACFLDYDKDGWLDLYVGAYVHDQPARDCTDSSGSREYCGPNTYRGAPDVLWRNEGDARFSNASMAAGISPGTGKALGVVSADFNGDGRQDIFVANDGEKNNLWINSESVTFEDLALLMGVATNAFGKPEASMGIALGDVNADQVLDLYLTHLVRETNTLYTGSPHGMQDSTAQTGSGAESMPYTGFGTAFLDADQDGDLDLAVVNGRVTRKDASATGPAQSSSTDPFELAYGEPNLFYLNEGAGRLANACGLAGEFCQGAEVGRGLAAGDLDNDGDIDLVVSNANGAARIYRNDFAGQGNWLQIRAVDPELQRDAIGATVEVFAAGLHMIRPVTHCYSYLSSSEAVTHFGLAQAQMADRIVVHWPDGLVENFPAVNANQSVTLHRGDGEALK